jgi:hypothetical protein
MISFTLATAFAVRVTGAAFLTSGTVVVAIRISLALKLFDYIKNYDFHHLVWRWSVENLYFFDAESALNVAPFRLPQQLPGSRIYSCRGLQTGL